MHSGSNANYTNLIVCSLQASAVGITLTKAHTAIFIEYPWSPSLMGQAEDRIHRIGQTQPCDIVYLYAKDSIDEYRLRTQNIKKTIINHAMKEVQL
jgi:similar to DNA helicase